MNRNPNLKPEKVTRMKSALQILRDADRGNLIGDIDDALERITGAVEAYGGAGEINIKLKIKQKNEAFQILVEMKAKEPLPPRLETVMFKDDDGNLSRRDPRQPELPEVVAADFRNGQRRPPTEKDE